MRFASLLHMLIIVAMLRSWMAERVLAVRCVGCIGKQHPEGAKAFRCVALSLCALCQVCLPACLVPDHVLTRRDALCAQAIVGWAAGRLAVGGPRT